MSKALIVALAVISISCSEPTEMTHSEQSSWVLACTATDGEVVTQSCEDAFVASTNAGNYICWPGTRPDYWLHLSTTKTWHCISEREVHTDQLP